MIACCPELNQEFRFLGTFLLPINLTSASIGTLFKTSK